MNYSAFSTYSYINIGWQNYWGGGGGKNDMFAPPQYFHWGGGRLPPGSTPLPGGGGRVWEGGVPLPRAAERIFIWGGKDKKKGTIMSKRALTVYADNYY